VASKELKVKKYQKRVNIQKDTLQQENMMFLYKNTLSNIDDKLKELMKFLHKKKEIEYKNHD
jgi:hypothetical protein